MSEVSSSEASCENIPWEQHLLLFAEGALEASSPSRWILCAKCAGCCAWRECGCPSV